MTTSSKGRVLCQWDISFCPWVLHKLERVAQVDLQPADRQWMLDHIHEYDAILLSLLVPLDKKLIARATRLKTVVTCTTGLDHLDLEALASRGIEVQSIKTEFELLDRVTATAELAWGLILATSRKLPAAHQAASRGQWARDLYRGRQLSGRTLGILGVGRLGSMIADYGKAFRMRVLGCDNEPRKSHDHVEYVDFNTLLRESDVLSIHIHLTQANRHLINRDALSLMKNDAIIVNTSRGAIIDETALVESLRAGNLGGAGLDVIEGEWRTDLVDHPLIALAREHANVVISPHVGGCTVESQAMCLQFCADRLAKSLAVCTCE